MFTCEFEVRNVLDTHYIESHHIHTILAVMLNISNYYDERISIFTLTYPGGSYTEMD